MAKKLEVKTKLAKAPSPQESEANPNLLGDPKTYSRSYRWREYDMRLIEDLVIKANSVSSRRIDATKILRGALSLASKKSPEKLLKSVIEAEKKSLVSRYDM